MFFLFLSIFMKALWLSSCKYKLDRDVSGSFLFKMNSCHKNPGHEQNSISSKTREVVGPNLPSRVMALTRGTFPDISLPLLSCFD